MSTTENSLPPDDMPVTPNSEPSQTDSVLKVPPRHQASTGEIAGNPEGSNEAPHSTISPRQARQRLNVPMPNMEVLAIDDALGIQTEIDKARDKFLDLVESLKTGRYLTDKIQGVEKHSGLGEPRAVIFHSAGVILFSMLFFHLLAQKCGGYLYQQHYGFHDRRSAQGFTGTGSL